MDDFVVLILHKNRGQLQYGYRSMAYNGEDDASWSGDTDMSPVYTFWNLYDGLVELGMDRAMSMIGMSINWWLWPGNWWLWALAL